MERGARCQVRSGVERVRFSPAHLVMRMIQCNSSSIYKLRGIMLALKDMMCANVSSLFRSRLPVVLLFSLSCFNYAINWLSCNAVTDESNCIRQQFELKP